MDKVWAEGESTLNSAMAVHVLRRFAELATYAHQPVNGRARAPARRQAGGRCSSLLARAAPQPRLARSEP